MKSFVRVAQTTIKTWITPNLHSCLLGCLRRVLKHSTKQHPNQGCSEVSWENALRSAWDSMLSDFKLISVACWETFRYCRVLNSLTFRGTPHLLRSQALGMTYESPGSASLCMSVCACAASCKLSGLGLSHSVLQQCTEWTAARRLPQGESRVIVGPSCLLPIWLGSSLGGLNSRAFKCECVLHCTCSGDGELCQVCGVFSGFEVGGAFSPESVWLLWREPR